MSQIGLTGLHQISVAGSLARGSTRSGEKADFASHAESERSLTRDEIVDRENDVATTDGSADRDADGRRQWELPPESSADEERDRRRTGRTKGGTLDLEA